MFTNQGLVLGMESVYGLFNSEYENPLSQLTLVFQVTSQT